MRAGRKVFVSWLLASSGLFRASVYLVERRGRGRGGGRAARGELAARGVYVPAARAAYEGAHALRFEHGLERGDALLGRRLVGQLVRGVVRDEVDLRAQGVTVEQSRECARVLVGVVDAVEHHVLEREKLARLQRLLELLARG